MTCHHGAVTSPRVKSSDLLLRLEPVVADDVKPVGQIKIMSCLAAVFVDIGPIIDDQPIERAPQRQITAVQHPGILPESPAGFSRPSHLWWYLEGDPLSSPIRRYRSSQMSSKRWPL